MEIKKLNETKEELVLEIDDIRDVEANTFRRLIIASTPTIAIDEIEFQENSSALYNEILANRLGLIPLKSDIKSYTFKEECKCKGKGCARCQLTITLDKEGPCTVYASDLQFSDPEIKAVYEKTPIVILLEKQKLKFSATTKLGTGKEHMKFSPGIVYYKNKPTIKVNNSSKKLAEFKDKYPKQIFKDGKISEEAIIKNNLDGVCEGICDDVIKVDYDENKFIINIESFGQLTTKEMFKTALEVFNKKLEELEKKVKSTKTYNIQKLASKIPKPTIKLPKRKK